MPGKPCTVCTHPDVQDINKMIVQGKPLTVIKSIYTDLSVMALSRHKNNHLTETLLRAEVEREEVEVQHASDLFTELQNLQAKALGLLQKAETAGDLRTAVSAVRETRATLELLAKASGQLPAEQVLIKVEPVINKLVVMLREEIKDPEILDRISRKLLGAGNDNTLDI